MSGKKSKTDLLVRVRYSNPLPPPPFAPRLLHIETSPARYTSYNFLQPLANEKEQPMIIDGELGMPLEFGRVREGEFGDGKYWMGDREAIAPTTAPQGFDEDALLFETAASTSSTPGLLSTGANASVSGGGKKLDVSWLRRTEYLSSEQSKGTGTQGMVAPKAAAPLLLLTPEARRNNITATFNAASRPLSELRHPTKTHLRAEESWDVLPDVGMWPNVLSLVKFGEDPGEGKTPAHAPTDPRLPRAIFRQVEIPGASRIAYYLPMSEETAKLYEERRREGPSEDLDEAFEFKHIRDYESAATRDLTGEYIVCFEDGPKDPVISADGAMNGNGNGHGHEHDATAEPASKKARGAFYAPVSSYQQLRKRRPKRGEDPKVFPAEVVEQGTEFWDGISIQVRGLDILPEDELENRQRYLDQVQRPSTMV